MKKTTQILLVALVAFTGSMAVNCSQDEKKLAGPEVTQMGALELDETSMSAEITDAGMTVYFPLANKGKSPIEVSYQIDLRQLSGDIVAKVSGHAVVDPGDNQVAVVLPEVEPFETPQEQSQYLVRYRFESPNATLIGRRSVFMLLPKIELAVFLPEKMLAETTSKVKTFAYNPLTGEPFIKKKLKLLIGLEGEKPQEYEAETDENGLAILVLEETPGTKVLKVVAYSQDGTEYAVEGKVEVIRDTRLLLTADKPMYQPGQIMHLRALALKKPNLEPRAQEDLVFEVFDAKGNKVFKRLTQTNDYGIAWAEFQLATQVNLGDYTLKATIGEVETEKTVKVDRYALPKFKVSVQLDKQFYMPGQTVLGTVSAGYFFGKPVIGGSVTVTPYTYDVEWTPLTEIQGQTNQEGLYSFNFQLPNYMVGQPLEGGKALVLLEIKVKDTADHEEKVAKNFLVTESLFDITVIPESGDVIPDISNVFYLFLTSPLGEPLSGQCTLTVNGAELASEDQKVVVPDSGVAKFSLTPHQGQLSLKIEATVAGNKASKQFDFSVGSQEAGILVRTDKTIYKVGESVIVDIFATGGYNHVYLDVVRSGQTVLTKIVDLQEGSGQIVLDLDQSLVYTLVIDAYLLSDSGQFIRDSRAIYVEPAKTLQLSFSTDKEEYKPGDIAIVNFHAKDSSDNPVQAALGIQVVDEAVFALSEVKPGLLKLYFELEQELSEPTYQIGVAGGVTFANLLLSQDQKPSGTEEDYALQDTAAALLAGTGGKLAGRIELDCWNKIKEKTLELLQPQMSAKFESIKEQIDMLAYVGKVDESNFTSYLTNLEMIKIADFWGQYFRIEEKNIDTVRITSAGMDETFGTWDDSTFELSYWDLPSVEERYVNSPARARLEADVVVFEGDEDWDGAVPNGEKSGSGGQEVKIRQWFPETLFVAPSVITDEDGFAQLEILLADSITEWRVTSLASTKTGLLGSRVDGITVFQDFFIDIDFPKYLTQNDEIQFPVAIYNYLDKGQNVEVKLQQEDWFELYGPPSTQVYLEPGEVSVVYFPVKVWKVGWHSLTVFGFGDNPQAKDAIKRTVEVKPDGKEVVATEGARFKGDSDQISQDYVVKNIVFPENTIDGSQSIIVRITPALSSHVVQGMDSMLKLPGG